MRAGWPEFGFLGRKICAHGADPSRPDRSRADAQACGEVSLRESPVRARVADQGPEAAQVVLDRLSQVVENPASHSDSTLSLNRLKQQYIGVIRPLAPNKS
jgi:hypothetical protein